MKLDITIELRPDGKEYVACFSNPPPADAIILGVGSTPAKALNNLFDIGDESYFSYDAFHNDFVEHATEEEARKCSEDVLHDLIHSALESVPEEVEDNNCWGRIMGKVKILFDDEYNLGIARMKDVG